MAFNKNTWTSDYSKAKGLKQLAKEEGMRKYGANYKPPKKSK